MTVRLRKNHQQTCNESLRVKKNTRCSTVGLIVSASSNREAEAEAGFPWWGASGIPPIMSLSPLKNSQNTIRKTKAYCS